MIRHNNPKNGGYVALMAVLIVGAASTAVALALIVAGTDSQRAIRASQQSAQARALSMACAEEALQQVNINRAYTGPDTLTLGQGSCTHTVLAVSGNERIISVTATVNNVVKKLEIYATMNETSITVTSWQEVNT